MASESEQSGNAAQATKLRVIEDTGTPSVPVADGTNVKPAQAPKARQQQGRPQPAQKPEQRPPQKRQPQPPSRDGTTSPAPAADTSGRVVAPVDVKDRLSSQYKPKKQRSYGYVGFLLMVIVPTLLVGFYYHSIAADQYQSELRFAVRGTNASPLAELGLSAIPGSTGQQADAYIVTDYIRSLQLLKDLRERYGLDVRELYSSGDIDFVYRSDPDTPMEEFLDYWNWMIDADYNSTTMITTFRVNAFSGEDAGKITKAVLGAAAELVNTLSSDAREQLISNAKAEVARTERSLSQAREVVTEFRNREQSLDPTLQAASDQELIQGLQKQLIDLKARRRALATTVSANSPSIKVLDRQIESVTISLSDQRRVIGTGSGEETENNNRSNQLDRYGRLAMAQEFAEKAYATAWSSLETATAEARKQERYFAIIVEPTIPEVALYPYRIVNTIIAFAIFLVVWLIFYLVLQSVRDHAK